MRKFVVKKLKCVTLEVIESRAVIAESVEVARDWAKEHLKPKGNEFVGAQSV